jgi:Amt family ammonium transporter
MFIIFTIIKKTIGLRVSREEEIAGLDIEEHGLVSSYADFMPAIVQGTSLSGKVESSEKVSADISIPVVRKTAASGDIKMTKLEIITNPSKFEVLKAALNAIGVTGMTVSEVMGCGMQKGGAEFYRGVEVEINLLPKVCVNVVVSKIPVDTVIEAAKKALYTGKIGDGKIFVYDVENVIKVRTGEVGYDALQDE